MMKFILLLLLTGCVTPVQPTQTAQVLEMKPAVEAKPYQVPHPIPRIVIRPPKPHTTPPSPDCMDNAVAFWERVYTSPGSVTFIFNDKNHTIYMEEEVPWKTRKHSARRMISQVKAKHRNVPHDDIKAQIGAVKTFTHGLESASRYVPRIKQMLREAGLPEDLAYIPLVESSFNLKARSRVGALGAWQIMPSTLRLYVKTNKKKLYDIEFATSVAIMILKHNYELLGSWPLAINAYHSGPGRMQKAKEALATDDMCTITQQFDGRGYKTASRNYYAQFLAAKSLYEKYNATVRPAENLVRAH
jgi:hypothetical protein